MFFSMASVYLGMKAAYLFALARALVRFEPLQRHFLFLALLYTAGIALLSYVFLLSWQGPDDLRAWEVWLAKSCGLAAVYFWMLGRFDEGALFWAILLFGGLGLVWF